MKCNLLVFTFTSVLVLIQQQAFSQSSDNIARKRILRAQEMIQHNQINRAEKFLRFSINEVVDKESIWRELGNIAFQTKQFGKAVDYYSRAMHSPKAKKETYILQIIDANIKNGNFMEAEYLMYPLQLNNKWNEEKKAYYHKLKKIVYSKNLVQKNDDEIINIIPLDNINTSDPEYNPYILPNDSVMYFTRKMQNMDEDLFITYKDSCKEIWSTPKNMGYPPNSTLNEGNAILSLDGKYMLFTKCGIVSDNGWEGGGCDIYTSYKEGSKWSAAQPFGATINTTGYEGMPMLSKNNKTLYFVSDRAGGQGGKDIWQSKLVDNKWQIPTNLGPNINTVGDELSPFLAPDDHTLYFVSDGHTGLGGFDIFYSKRDEKGEWSKPINIGAPYNSPTNEWSLTTSPNGEKIYFSSDRVGGKGQSDIYEANLIERYQPNPVIFISGHITDSIGNHVVTTANIDIIDENGNIIESSLSNSGDGSYFFALPAYQSYKIKVRRYDYPEQLFNIQSDTLNVNPGYVFNPPLLHWSYVNQMNNAYSNDNIETESDEYLLVETSNIENESNNQDLLFDMKWDDITTLTGKNIDTINLKAPSYLQDLDETYTNQYVTIEYPLLNKTETIVIEKADTINNKEINKNNKSNNDINTNKDNSNETHELPSYREFIKP